MATFDGEDEGGFDGAEGCRMKVFIEFAFGGVIAKNDVGLVWKGMC